MKIKIGVIAVVAATLMAGCISAPFVPPLGAISVVKAPLSVDHNKTAVTTKAGTSDCICILGLVAVGDASTQTAAENGKLKTIQHADYEYLNILGIFQKTTVVVHGE